MFDKETGSLYYGDDLVSDIVSIKLNKITTRYYESREDLMNPLGGYEVVLKQSYESKNSFLVKPEFFNKYSAEIFNRTFFSGEFYYQDFVKRLWGTGMFLNMVSTYHSIDNNLICEADFTFNILSKTLFD